MVKINLVGRLWKIFCFLNSRWYHAEPSQKYTELDSYVSLLALIIPIKTSKTKEFYGDFLPVSRHLPVFGIRLWIFWKFEKIWKFEEIWKFGKKNKMFEFF